MKKIVALFTALTIFGNANIGLYATESNNPVAEPKKSKPITSTTLAMIIGIPTGLTVIGTAVYLITRMCGNKSDKTENPEYDIEISDEQIQIMEIQALNALAQGYNGYDNMGNPLFASPYVKGYCRSTQFKTDSLVQNYAQGAGIEFANISIPECPKNICLTYVNSFHAEKLLNYVREVLVNKFLDNERGYPKSTGTVSDDDLYRLYDRFSGRKCDYVRLYKFYTFFKAQLRMHKIQDTPNFLITEKKDCKYHDLPEYSIRPAELS